MYPAGGKRINIIGLFAFGIMIRQIFRGLVIVDPFFFLVPPLISHTGKCVYNTGANMKLTFHFEEDGCRDAC